jgi:hypothetical protein
MRDYLEIGPTPSDEDCAQVGGDDYYRLAQIECEIFILQLRRELGPEPPGAKLRTVSFPHDFGTYHEVVCYYDSNEGLSYALDCESSNPNWDEQAIVQLRQAGLPAREQSSQS